MLLALWFLTDTGWRRAVARSVAVILLLAASIWLLNETDALARECLYESDYFCINVRTTTRGGRELRELVLDRLVHSYSDLEDPTNLQYGYERTYAHVIEPLLDENPSVDIFYIGGGGYTFPRYVEAKYPESYQVVAEIDPLVTDVAYARLGLDPDTDIETHNMDARLYLEEEAEPDRFDIVFGDAFNDYSVPFHLTTLEFDQMVADVLREDGLYVVNIIDGGKHGLFLRAYVHTLSQVFEHVQVIPTLSNWEESVRSTFVIVASQQPIDLSALASGERAVPVDEFEAYMAMEEPILLTDDYVPVDNLLAPVFEESADL
jgi:spermidine synthase